MTQIAYSELTKRWYFLPENGKNVDITDDIQEIIKASRPSIDIVSELRKIAKLSTYDANHDKMLYNVKEINKLVKELLNKEK